MPAILKWTPRIARIIVLVVLVGVVCGASAHPVRSVPLGWLSPALDLFASQANASIYLPTIFRANGTPVAARRPWRDTTSGIHVFNDQLASGMSEAQWQFSATHYAGTQKMTRDAADRLRAINPNFLILHYRLGLGLGYRPISDGCNPSGDYVRIIEGNAWVQEWNPAALEGKAVIGQSYALGDQERLFTLGTYLLIKGQRTYLNLELDLDPEWWPEYDIPMGAPTQSAGTQITNLYDATNQVYRRNFSNGFVLVNPTSPSDGSGVTRTVNLGGSYYRAVTSGGGAVPTSGVPTGTLTYQAVTSVTLPPTTAVVLFNAHP